jgi:Tfp pilus assembly protein PilW
MCRRNGNRTRNAPGGFTLLETLIASGIFLMVLYGVYLIYDTGEANYRRGSRMWDVQSQARVAMERMAREIRMAGYNTPNKPTDPVVIATNDTISFHADVNDGNGLRYLTYSRRDCSGNLTATLYRNTSATTFCGGDEFISNVAGLAFTYFELNNVTIPYPLTSTYQLDSQAHVTGASTPSAPAANGFRSRVRQVKIALTVQQQVGAYTLPFTMTTDVALRNLLP